MNFKSNPSGGGCQHQLRRLFIRLTAVRRARAGVCLTTILLLAGVLTSGVGFFGASSDAEAATPCGSTGSFVSPSSCSYTATGQDSFTVPLGVTSLELVADGGAGGLGGGDGVQVTADIPVTPGNKEYVEVGVGGGAGGSGFITRAGPADGGSGGGLSGVYSCSGDGTNPSCALLVGGGGGGGGNVGVGGGDGGTGSLLCNPGVAGDNDGSGGGGGCSAGGSAGEIGQLQVEGNPGAPGGGGGGGNASNVYGACALGGYCLFGGGGGGGGGYYGGGGGAGSDGPGGAGSGGGGGSSFAEASASNVSMLSDSGTPSVTITWASKSDDYSYTANGGTGTAPASGSGPDGTTITLAANTFSYPGYVFARWSDGTATYAAGGTYTLSSGGAPIVFTAQWSDNPVDTVAFNSDGGAAVSSLSGPDGGSIALPSDTYSGYTFIGWFTQASGGSEVGGAGSSYIVPTGGTTLYARWSENPIDTIAFNSDGGAAVSSISGPDGSSITLPSDYYPGYTFDGWFTSTNGGTEIGGVGSSYTVPAGGTTLYAQWSEHYIYTVTFNSDGGAAVSSVSGPEGSSIALPSDTYSGYTLIGWFTQASGGSEVGGAGASYTIPEGGNTLFAQWLAANAPTITKFTPTSGPVGTVVTIKGTHLLGASQVTFNGVEGTITRDRAVKIKVKVPVGATKGLIEVTTPGGDVESATKFKVT